MSLPVVALVAVAVALVVTPLAIVVARRTGIMDRPGALKSQTAPVPYLGGVAVLAGAAVGAAIGRPSVLIPLVLALALGVADDRWDVPPPLRIAGEVVIGDGWVAAVLLVVITMLLTNGMNLLDGLDMLAAGVAAVAAGGFALLVHGSGRELAVALAAALVGFLVFNRPPARIYLGDGGTYLLGTALAVLLAASWAPGVAAPIGLAALVLVAVPSGEVAFAVIRRRRGRQSLTAGDRGHPYDRLVARGWHRTSASLAYIVVELVLATAAVVVGRHAGWPAALALDLGAAVVLVALAGVTGGLTPDQEAPA
jgi:UDP-GlcNAc:undecaprenyl-phosphate GlcNAc-1-phosphate transferase